MKTEILNIKKSTFPGKVRGFCDIRFDGELTIKGCRIIEGSKGPFIGMPSKKNEKTGEWHDFIWIDSNDLRTQLNDDATAVLAQVEGQGQETHGTVRTARTQTQQPQRQSAPVDDDDVPF